MFFTWIKLDSIHCTILKSKNLRFSSLETLKNINMLKNLLLIETWFLAILKRLGLFKKFNVLVLLDNNCIFRLLKEMFENLELLKKKKKKKKRTKFLE